MFVRGNRGFALRVRLVAPSLVVAALLLLSIRATAAASLDPIADPLTRQASTLKADARQGRLIYKDHCAQCHGNRGEGDAKLVVPVLAGQRYSYLVRQLANFAAGQRESTTMHRVLAPAVLREPQTWVDLAAYLSREHPAGRVASGDGSELGLGKGIFLNQCRSCHGAGARGSEEDVVPSLRAQHYPYLVDQIGRLADGARHNVDEALAQFLLSLDREEIQAVADFLSRLPSQSATPAKAAAGNSRDR